MKLIHHLSLLSGFLILAAAHGETVKLAAGGKAMATIVVAEGAPPVIRQAAADLQHYVHAICGVKLPIHSDGKTVAGDTGIYLGECAASQELDLPDDANPESFAIRVRDGGIFLAARHPTPVAFAVSSLIEQNLGVRWFAPGELWEHVPQGTPGELVMEVDSRVSIPDTSPRIWSGHGWYPSWETWNRRNKVAMPEVYPRREFQNNVYIFFPASKYAQTHPEYFPLVDGKRWIPQSDDAWDWFPCTSNPDVIQLIVESARQWLDANPTRDSFSLGMDDVEYICGCDACRALDATPDDYAKRTISNRYYQFVNAVARELRKSHPDRLVGLLVYREARNLPATVQKLEPNVFGYLTEECFSWWQPGQKDADQQLSRDWAQRCDHLSRYDYYGMATFTPRVAPHEMADQIKLDKSLGFEGMYVEVYTFLPHTAPMIWALAKMQWDSEMNVDALLEEFYLKMYGPSSAPAMKRYFDWLETTWMENRPDRTHGWVHRNLKAQGQAMTPQQARQALELLDEAIAQAGDDPKVLGRMQLHRAGMVLSAQIIESFDLAMKLSNVQIDGTESAERALALAGELADAADRRRECFDQARLRDDLLGQTLRALSDQFHYLQVEALTGRENLCYGSTIEALQWLSTHEDPAAFEGREDQLRLAAAGRPFAKILDAWSMVSDRRCENLFEKQPKQTDGALKVIAMRKYLVGGKVTPAANSESQEKPVALRVGFRDAAGQRIEQDFEPRATLSSDQAEQWIWTVAQAPLNARWLVIIPDGWQTSEQAAEAVSDLTVYWLE